MTGLLVVSVAGVAAAGSSKEKSCVSNLCFEAGGGFSPKKLSKTKQTPIALTAEGKITTTDGSHPPALTEAVIETDKNGAVNVKGLATCKKSKLQSQDTKHAKAACLPALIGTGTTDVSIAFPESKDVTAHSQLLVFNGGVKGGVTTLYIHAYITVPVPAAIVTTVKISKVHNGRYGLKSVATIPKIASGSGSVTSFKLTINKKFTSGGKKVSVLTAKCPDGRLQAHAVAKFANGLTATTEFVRPCTGT
ncbi:MAG TPA: hypothetical protein VMT37_04200 [Solirubrobacterales bacterium]|nr:hypothetical protein [Solirubrobacterales bacterium]